MSKTFEGYCMDKFPIRIHFIHLREAIINQLTNFPKKLTKENPGNHNRLRKYLGIIRNYPKI